VSQLLAESLHLQQEVSVAPQQQERPERQVWREQQVSAVLLVWMASLRPWLALSVERIHLPPPISLDRQAAWSPVFFPRDR
jgi:hypothetical protein